MRIIRNYGQLLFAAMLSVLLLCASYPASAADMTGKTVTAVNISGNFTVDQSTVMSAVKLKPGDTLTADQVKQDLQSIYELGYFYNVEANFAEVPEGVKVTYTVLENPAVHDVTFKGNTKVSSDKLRSLVGVAKGKTLNAKDLNKSMRDIEQYYHDQGYILAKVSDVSMDPNGVINVVINEGMLEGITIKGNEKTKDYVITREMKIKPGEPFNVKDARRSMQKVYNLGYFEDVNMKLNPGKDPNAVVLETDVTEQKTGTFSIGGGYSKADGLVGIIEVGDTNLRGSGDQVKLHWEFGGNAGNRNYSIGFTRPWLDDKQTSLGFNIYNMTNEYNDYGYQGNDQTIRSTYDRKAQGFDVTLGRPQNEYLQDYVTFKSKRDSFVKYVSGPVDYSAAQGATGYDSQYNTGFLKDNFGLTRSVTLMRVYDSRDNVFNPTEGKRLSLSAEFAGKMFGGDFNFNKYTAEDRQYLKVGHAQVVALRVVAGYATGHISESNQFAVGGADTLRGYDDEEFKGDKMLTATAEYRFPVAKKIQGVVFSDIGNAWNGEGYKLNDLKASVGVGVRVTTPIGPIRLDYAKGSEGGKMHFSFGGQF